MTFSQTCLQVNMVTSSLICHHGLANNFDIQKLSLTGELRCSTFTTLQILRHSYRQRTFTKCLKILELIMWKRNLLDLTSPHMLEYYHLSYEAPKGETWQDT